MRPEQDPAAQADQSEQQFEYVPLKERLKAIPAAFAVLLPILLISALVLFIVLLLMNLF